MYVRSLVELLHLLYEMVNCLYEVPLRPLGILTGDCGGLGCEDRL
jgi:hypothetical protein